MSRKVTFFLFFTFLLTSGLMGFAGVVLAIRCC